MHWKRKLKKKDSAERSSYFSEEWIWEEGEKAHWKNSWYYPETTQLKLHAEQLDIYPVSKNWRSWEMWKTSQKRKEPQWKLQQNSLKTGGGGEVSKEAVRAGKNNAKKGKWRPNDWSRNCSKVGKCRAFCQVTICKRRNGPIESKDGKHPQIWVEHHRKHKKTVKGTGFPNRVSSTLIHHLMKYGNLAKILLISRPWKC